MNCPKCGYGFSKVIDSRDVLYGKRRRRECADCGFRYTGIEILDSELFRYKKMVRDAMEIKKQMEAFCREYEDSQN